jgi:hypothetical protein
MNLTYVWKIFLINEENWSAVLARVTGKIAPPDNRRPIFSATPATQE